MLTLSSRQTDIVIGSLLGDGCLSKVVSRGNGKRNKKPNSKFSETHGAKQAEWIKWKQKQLEPIPVRYGESLVVARKNLGNGLVVNDPARKYLQCCISTVTHPVFTTLERQWYARNDDGTYKMNERGRRIKCLPPDLKLTPLAVAVWAMDDGSNQQHRKAYNLATLAFTYDEVCLLNDMVNGIGFKCQVCPQKGQFYLYIGEKSYLDFIEMVRSALPDLPECMKYKIDTSRYKLSWKKSSDYWPHSKFNDEVVDKIMADARQKMPQREIAKKYDIHYKYINRLLKGYTLYKSEFADAVNYRSTTGVEGVSYSKKRNRYIASIALPKGNSKYLHLCLGYYRDLETAAKVAGEARRMRSQGILDPTLYRKMKSETKAAAAVDMCI